MRRSWVVALGKRVFVDVEPPGAFYRAEDYHSPRSALHARWRRSFLRGKAARSRARYTRKWLACRARRAALGRSLALGRLLGYHRRVEIFIYSRGAIERIPPHEVPHVIVSITSSESDQARLPPSPHCRALLRLSFADADATSESIPEHALFSRKHARAIWGLLEEHMPYIERFIVHCDAGMCRSPAVAAAISKVVTGDDAEYFRRYRPNMRVYRTMLETYYEESAHGENP